MSCFIPYSAAAQPTPAHVPHKALYGPVPPPPPPPTTGQRSQPHPYCYHHYRRQPASPTAHPSDAPESHQTLLTWHHQQHLQQPRAHTHTQPQLPWGARGTARGAPFPYYGSYGAPSSPSYQSHGDTAPIAWRPGPSEPRPAALAWKEQQQQEQEQEQEQEEAQEPLGEEKPRNRKALRKLFRGLVNAYSVVDLLNGGGLGLDVLQAVLLAGTDN